MTALKKPDGGVRGIVAGDVVSRLVARTMSQQLGPATMAATAPHQFALSTRAGCECVAHMLQGVTELNPGITVDLHRRCVCVRHDLTKSHDGRVAAS